MPPMNVTHMPHTTPQVAFETRHIGLNDADTQTILQTLGAGNIDEFLNQVIPARA